MRRVLMVLVVIVALLAIAAGAWAATTQPLSFGSAGGVGLGPLLSSVSDPDDEHYVRYTYLEQPGATFALLISVHNDGPLPITILGTGDPKNQRMRHGFWREDFVLIPTEGPVGLEEQALGPAMTSVEVQPGWDVYLWARYRISSKCADEIVPRDIGTYIGTDALHVDWQVLGVTRHSVIPMDIEVRTTNPGPGQIPCPGPAATSPAATSPDPVASPAG